MNEKSPPVVPSDDGTTPTPAPIRTADVAVLVFKVVFGLLARGGVAALLARFLREEVSEIATALVAKLGLLGIAIGVFAADSVNVPIPVQTYQLAVIAEGGPQVAPLAVMVAASLLGGHLGFFLGGRLERRAWVQRLLARVVRRREHLWERYGYRALLLAAVIPFRTPRSAGSRGSRRSRTGASCGSWCCGSEGAPITR